MRRPIVNVIVMLTCVGALAACDSGTTTAARNDPSATSTTTSASPRALDAVLDDSGLHLPAGRIEAADYRISFADRRTKPPAGQRVALRLRVSGPDVTLVEVPPGGTRDAAILQNVVAYVAIDGKDANVPIDHQLDVVASKEYPVPAT